MPKRFITRIELTTKTRTGLDAITSVNGMTQVSVLSRLVNWFGDQPNETQLAILAEDRFPLDPPVADRILQKMASSK